MLAASLFFSMHAKLSYPAAGDSFILAVQTWERYQSSHLTLRKMVKAYFCQNFKLLLCSSEQRKVKHGSNTEGSLKYKSDVLSVFIISTQNCSRTVYHEVWCLLVQNGSHMLLWSRHPLCGAVGQRMTYYEAVHHSRTWLRLNAARLWTMKAVTQRVQLLWWVKGGNQQLHTWQGREVSVNKDKNTGVRMVAKNCKSFNPQVTNPAQHLILCGLRKLVIYVFVQFSAVL